MREAIRGHQVTASGLCFDFSNSSYLMREAIRGHQSSLAIKRNHAQSRRHRPLERVVSSASYMTARKSCTMKKPPSMTTKKK
jgi:hypothetical protein